ncbi:STAS domain-containing protein [Sphaerisporangium sp. NPDC088356]|uniref:STAS domain-containing protein n=1 Tax=Sphaerisporangium sp. NPDC088356 TaxID=3154871 RepID=UPI0034203982
MGLKLAISRHRDPDCTLVGIIGDLDATTYSTARDQLSGLLAEGHVRIVMDVTELGFCDSGGIWILLEIHRRAKRDGGWVRLAGVNGFLQRLFTLTRLDAAFTIDADVTASLAAVTLLEDPGAKD